MDTHLDWSNISYGNLLSPCVIWRLHEAINHCMYHSSKTIPAVVVLVVSYTITINRYSCR